MGARDRIELQAEVDAPRASVWRLVATAEGLGRWLDEAELEPRPGADFRFRLLDAEAVGQVIAVDPPQHISLRWSWRDEPAAQSVVAFDAIDHGARTHLTLRHVGLRDSRQLELHEALWSHWFPRLCRAAGGRTDVPADVAG
jgi:uncharacterized protein YndB with AHSA1/START domain